MLILNPVLYLDTIGLLQTEDDEHSGLSLFSPEVPGMQSRGGARLASVLQNWQIRHELARREARQKFGAGDYFVIGDPSRVAVVTVGVNRSTDCLSGVVDFLKKTGGRVLLLSEFAEDPGFDDFQLAVVRDVGCEIVDLSDIKQALKTVSMQ